MEPSTHFSVFSIISACDAACPPFPQAAIDHALAFVGGVMIAVASLELIPEAVGALAI